MKLWECRHAIAGGYEPRGERRYGAMNHMNYRKQKVGERRDIVGY